jgi:hypothetical protein
MKTDRRNPLGAALPCVGPVILCVGGGADLVLSKDGILAGDAGSNTVGKHVRSGKGTVNGSLGETLRRSAAPFAALPNCWRIIAGQWAQSCYDKHLLSRKNE